MNMEAIQTFIFIVCILVFLVIFYFSKVKYSTKKNTYYSLALMGISQAKQSIQVLLEPLPYLILTIMLAIYYVFYWSSLVTDWPNSHLGKWELFQVIMAHPEWNPVVALIWAIPAWSLIFYFFGIIYPLYKINGIYKGGHKDV